AGVLQQRKGEKMNNIESLCITKEVSIREALDVIDQNKKQLALVLNEEKKLIGSVTDGDVRRALLKNISLDNPVSTIMNNSPKYLKEGITKQEALKFMQKHKIHHLPLLNKDNQVVNLLTLDEL